MSDPMHHTVRQRRNKSSTRAELEVLPEEDRAAIEVPELPADRMWHPRVSDWWRDIWQSPMRLEWDASDTATVLVAAILLDEFLIEAGRRSEGEAPSAYKLTNLASQFAAVIKPIGGSPFARRSLQWIMVQTERGEAERELAQARTQAKRAKATKGSKAAGARRRGLDGLG